MERWTYEKIFVSYCFFVCYFWFYHRFGGCSVKKVFRDGKGQEATMIFEMDNKVSEETKKKIENLELVHKVISISPAKEEE